MSLSIHTWGDLAPFAGTLVAFTAPSRNFFHKDFPQDGSERFAYIFPLPYQKDSEWGFEMARILKSTELPLYDFSFPFLSNIKLKEGLSIRPITADEFHNIRGALISHTAKIENVFAQATITAVLNCHPRAKL
jgi:hypothetical protein